MYFKIVECRYDQCGVGSNYYDCNFQTNYYLENKNEELIWIKRVKKNNSKIIWKTEDKNDIIQVGGHYGLISVPYFDNLFTFNDKDIEELNEFLSELKRRRSIKIKDEVFRQMNKKQKELKSQFREFIIEQIKKLGISGSAIISSSHSSYPARKDGFRTYEEEALQPFVKETYFGLMIFQFEDRKEALTLLNDWVRIGEGENNCAPSVVVF